MPIINNFIENESNTKILIWKLTEPINTLLKITKLSMSESKIYNSLILKRKKEFLGIRYALMMIGIPINKLFYNKRGKPILKNNKKHHISFSHTYQVIAIGISKYPIGIDIEMINSKKILKIKKKFLREDEIVFIKEKNIIEQLHIIWGIKESLYKLNGGYLKNMISNYKIMPFSINDRYIKSWIIEKTISKRFSAYHKKIDNYQLVYIIDYN